MNQRPYTNRIYSPEVEEQIEEAKKRFIENLKNVNTEPSFKGNGGCIINTTYVDESNYIGYDTYEITRINKRENNLKVEKKKNFNDFIRKKMK